MFDAKLTPYTIAEFCQAMQRNEVRVNYDYQRSPKVWPPAARSFLIETILLAYPMPKISLHQITDVKTRKTLKEIVDGQQRSMTIYDFYNGKLRLDKKALPPEAAGKTYPELDEQWQYRFLNYALSVDLFIGATKEDIREVFRRMNSYTVPLNAEERRHSKFQGEFKWFVYRLSKRYSEALENIGVFTEKQLNRMQDAKLFSEIIHAMLKGITTTKDRELTRLYEEFDKEFPQEEDVTQRIDQAMNLVLEYKSLHQGPLMKPYQLYALMLAIMHSQKSLPSLEVSYSFDRRRKVFPDRGLENIARLAAAADDPESDRKLEKFVQAGAEKTNVADQRKERFIWYCRALVNDMP